MAKKAGKPSAVSESGDKPISAKPRLKIKITGKLIGKIVIWIFVTALLATPNLLYTQSGIGFSSVSSGSMKPVMNAGEVLLTKNVRASTLKVGDIINVYNQVAGTHYSHRIVAIHASGSGIEFVTKGDANSANDAISLLVLPTDAVHKEYLIFPPWAGRILVFLWSNEVRKISLIFLAFSYVVILFLLLFRKKIKENFGHEKVYKELYSEERATSAHYKKVLDHLKEIESEKNLIQKSR